MIRMHPQSTDRSCLPRRGCRDGLPWILPASLFLISVTPLFADEWIVRCRDQAQALLVLQDPGQLGAWRQAGVRITPALPAKAGLPGELDALLRIQLPDGQDVAHWRKRLEEELDPVWLETPPVRTTDLIPNDTRYSELWALPRIQAPQAWDQHQGEGELVLAVVDTGVDWSHPDLMPVLWTNAAEAGGAPGLDDDGNGFVDDLHGADLLDEDGNPMPAAGDYSHGTHVAGTAACATNNALGVACAAWNVRLMSVRAGHQGSVSRGAEGIWYAAQAGADIINCSWGGNTFSAYENEVIQAVRDMGVLVVASAGNDGSSAPHYPGSYEGVLCVAATTAADTRLAGSQFGWWVDVSAPGDGILSSLIGTGYGLKSGTSMATPLVSSLCALVWSRFPTERAEQVRERVKATCDNIDALNPGYSGQLGRGRVNALRAVTETPRAVELLDWTVTDGGGDGIPDPGETVQLRLGVEALLGNFNQLMATCQVQPGEAQVLDGQIAFGSLNQGQTAAPQADTFSLLLDPDLVPGQEIRIHLTFTATGGFSQGADLLLLVAPTFVDHDNGDLLLSVGAGVLGYFDFADNQSVGNGLRWPADSPSHLYHGSLLFAINGGQVGHATSYLQGQVPDFHVLPGGEPRRTEQGTEVISESQFTVDGLPGLRVTQEVRSQAGADWLLVRAVAQNSGSHTLAGLQSGLWLDFDVMQSYGNDTGGWDATSGTAWQSQAGGPWLGLRLLSGAASSFRLCRWSEWQSAGLQDAELFSWLRGGFQQTQSSQADDWQCCLGAATQDLAPGDQRETAYALLAGNSLASLLAAGVQAQAAWEALEIEMPMARPAKLELRVAPNPFNPETTMSLELPHAGPLAWRVVALDGRVAAQGSRSWLPQGHHTERLELSGLASGLYLLDVEQGGNRGVTRLLLVR